MLGKCDLIFMKKFRLDDVYISVKSMKYIVRYKWNYLKSLEFVKNGLNNKKLSMLMHSKWPKLKYLFILDNFKVTNDSFKIFKKCKWPKLHGLFIIGPLILN